MNAVRSSTVFRSASRPGLIAISEMLVLVVALVGLFWLGSQLIAVAANVPASAAKRNCCSDRRVYRILAEKNGEKLWIYRPNDGIVRIELATKEIDFSMPLSGVEVTAVSHSADGSTTLLCGLNGSVMLFHGDKETKTTRLSKRDDFVLEAAVSEDGSTAVAMTATAEVKGWRRTATESVGFSYLLENRQGVVRAMLNSEGTQLCVARLSGEVTFHEPQSGTVCSEPLQIDKEWLCGDECIGFATSSDDHFLGVATSTGKIRIYDLANRGIILESQIGDATSAGRVTAFAISANARQIALATNTESAIQLWNLDAPEVIRHLDGHEGIVRSVQFSPTANRLYSGSYDGTVREWSLATCSQMRVLD